MSGVTKLSLQMTALPISHLISGPSAQNTRLSKYSHTALHTVHFVTCVTEELQTDLDNNLVRKVNSIMARAALEDVCRTHTHERWPSMFRENCDGGEDCLTVIVAQGSPGS